VTSMKPDKATEAIIEEAAQWVVCLGARDVSMAERRRFVAWIKRSPVHLQEYLRIETTWSDLGRVDAQRRTDIAELLVEAEADAEVIELTPGTTPAVLSKRRSRSFIAALAASIVVCIVALFWYHTQLAGRYVTGVGEQRTARLDDGSTIVLNTGTELRVEFTDQLREVRLIKGEALFNVTSDAARPFRVLSDRTIAQAIGTSFVVRRNAEQTIVTVIEGQVAVASQSGVTELKSAQLPRESQRLAAGVRAHVADDVIETAPVANTAAVTAWRTGRLIFDGETLAEAAAEFNRYNEVQIVIEDPQLAGERLSGVFDAHQPQSLVLFLERSGAIEPTTVAGGRIVLVPRR
jgi:transmembrane sensor